MKDMLRFWVEILLLNLLLLLFSVAVVEKLEFLLRIMICYHQIIELCLKMITYDPNYNYEDEEEGGGGEDEEMEDETAAPDADPDSDSEEYSDDDDMSWKVTQNNCRFYNHNSSPSSLS